MATSEQNNRQTSLEYIKLGETVDEDGNRVDLLVVATLRKRDNFRMQRSGGQKGRSQRPSATKVKELYRSGKIDFAEGGEERLRSVMGELNVDLDSDAPASYRKTTRKKTSSAANKNKASTSDGPLDNMTVPKLRELLKELGGSPYVSSKPKTKPVLIKEIQELQAGGATVAAEPEVVTEPEPVASSEPVTDTEPIDEAVAEVPEVPSLVTEPTVVSPVTDIEVGDDSDSDPDSGSDAGSGFEIGFGNAFDTSAPATEETDSAFGTGDLPSEPKPFVTDIKGNDDGDLGSGFFAPTPVTVPSFDIDGLDDLDTSANDGGSDGNGGPGESIDLGMPSGFDFDGGFDTDDGFETESTPTPNLRMAPADVPTTSVKVDEAPSWGDDGDTDEADWDLDDIIPNVKLHDGQEDHPSSFPAPDATDATLGDGFVSDGLDFGFDLSADDESEFKLTAVTKQPEATFQPAFQPDFASQVPTAEPVAEHTPDSFDEFADIGIDDFVSDFDEVEDIEDETDEVPAADMGDDSPELTNPIDVDEPAFQPAVTFPMGSGSDIDFNSGFASGISTDFKTDADAGDDADIDNDFDAGFGTSSDAGSGIGFSFGFDDGSGMDLDEPEGLDLDEPEDVDESEVCDELEPLDEPAIELGFEDEVEDEQEGATDEETGASVTSVPPFLVSDRIQPRHRRKVARRQRGGASPQDTSSIANRITFAQLGVTDEPDDIAVTEGIADLDEPVEIADESSMQFDVDPTSGIMFAPGVGVAQDEGDGQDDLYEVFDAMLDKDEEPVNVADSYDELGTDDLGNLGFVDEPLKAIDESQDDDVMVSVKDDEEEDLIDIFDDLDQEGIKTSDDLMSEVYPSDGTSIADAYSSYAAEEPVGTIDDAKDAGTDEEPEPYSENYSGFEFAWSNSAATDAFDQGYGENPASADNGFVATGSEFETANDVPVSFIDEVPTYAEQGIMDDTQEPAEASGGSPVAEQADTEKTALVTRDGYPLSHGTDRGLDEGDRELVRKTFKRMLIEVGVVALIAIVAILVLHFVIGVPIFPTL